MRKIVRALGVICAVASTTAMFTVTSAQAQESSESAVAENPYTAAEACAKDHDGDWAQVSGEVRKIQENGVVYGEVYLMHDRGTGEKCVVTLKRRAVGKDTRVFAMLSLRGEGSATEDKDSKYYLSVSAPARDKCVLYKGGMTNGGEWRLSDDSGWVGNCD